MRKESGKGRREQEQKKVLWMLLLLVCIAGLAVSIVGILVRQHRQKAAEAHLEILSEMTTEAIADTEEPDIAGTEEDMRAESEIPIPEKNIDFAALQEENPDIYAWVYVPETDVDYPVLQHPTDDTYYLNHNIDGSKGYPACIYSESLNSKDFTDPHTVFYGHNMDDGSMFGSLHNFEDEDTFEGDHYIYVYTPEKVYVYQIFAAYEYPAIHLLYNFDLEDPTVFAYYLDQIFACKGRVANIRQDIPVNAQSHILTLSTCTADHENSLRFLVQGVLLNEEE